MKRHEWALAVVAFLIYASAITWGIPDRNPRERPDSWATDELAPGGLLEEVGNAIYYRSGTYNPKYPMFGYAIQSALAGPYYVLTAGLSTTKTRELPYFWWIGVLARLTTMLMAAGLVVVSCRTYEALFGGECGWLAGLVVMLLPPMFYYGRTTNVDLPALALGAVVLWQFAIVLRDGLTRRTAILLGIFAGLGPATKDAVYGLFVPAAVIIVAREWRRAPKLILLAGAVTVGVYLVASGILINPDRYFQHAHFVRHGSNRHLGFHYGNTQPYWLVAVKHMRHLVEAMSLPLFLASLAGLWMCRKNRSALLWSLAAPSVLVFCILPARFTLYRFGFPMAYVLALFGAYALMRLPARRMLIAGVAGWLAIRGADVTQQMWNDSRYHAMRFFEANAKPGQSIGWYGGEANKLPFTDRRIALAEGPKAFPAPEGPDWVIVIPWADYDRPEHEYLMPQEAYRALASGTAGYKLRFKMRSPKLFAFPGSGLVNPLVSIYERER